MQVNNVSPVSFQATIPRALKDELFDVARARGSAACYEFLEHAKNVETWGLSTSTLSVDKYKVPSSSRFAYDQTHETRSVLKLLNNYFAPFKKVEFKQKDTLFDTFMSLTERDIQNAENMLKI